MEKKELANSLSAWLGRDLESEEWATLGKWLDEFGTVILEGGLNSTIKYLKDKEKWQAYCYVCMKNICINRADKKEHTSQETLKKWMEENE